MANTNTESVDFLDLQKSLDIKDQGLFMIYLKEVYNDLSEKIGEKKHSGVSSITFYDYMKLPIFISGKLFAAFDKDKDGYLNSVEFIEGFSVLYTGEFDSTLEIIFNMYDFDRDGLINREDIKILLSYLPLKKDQSLVEYKYQMESLDEIDELLKDTFDNKKQMNLHEFENAISKKRSDIFLLILCFLYQKKPFNSMNIESFKASKKKIFDTPNLKAKVSTPNIIGTPGQKLLLSPTKKSTFSAIEAVLQCNAIRELGITGPSSKASFIDNNNPFISGIKGMVRMNNKKVNPDIKGQKESNTNSTNDDESIQATPNLDSVIKNSVDTFSSPSQYFKKAAGNTKSLEDFNLANNLVSIDKFKLNEEDDSDEDEDDEDGNKKETKRDQPKLDPQAEGASVFTKFADKNQPMKHIEPVNKEGEQNSNEPLYENFIYKLSSSGDKIFKYFLSIKGKDIFYYKDDKKDNLLGMHNLTGCYIKENGDKKVNGEKFYCFQVIFPGKERNYYTPVKENALNFVKFLKKGIGYQNFFDYYEMLDDIGEGKFGTVKLGIHKATKQRVAIKIIKKEKMKQGDAELIRSEIDIMKLCHHPNIVRLLDHFENAEYIFIVMEYLSGGSLRKYFEKHKYKFSEKRAAEIMFQIGLGISYLHQYGVVHRDLKPDNIMMTENENMSQIKVMDFGLSKIMSPTESAADGFGTLIFVAPEVLIRKPYNTQIDVWSMGVILYNMLTGILPFDDESDEEEIIAKKIVFKQCKYPEAYFKKRSPDVQDLIKNCLIKEPDKRIKIKNFLNHKWFKGFGFDEKQVLIDEGAI